MGAGWRIDGAGVRDVVERSDADAQRLSSGLGEVSARLDDVVGLLDDVVGPALRRFDERWQESATSVDRRTAAVVEAARAVVRDHRAADEEMAGHSGSGLRGAEMVDGRFSPRVPQ